MDTPVKIFNENLSKRKFMYWNSLEETYKNKKKSITPKQVD